MKVLIKFNKNIAVPKKIKTFKVFEIGEVTTNINDLLDITIIEIDDETLPILKIINNSYTEFYIINNLGINNNLSYPYYTDDFTKDITVNDLILISSNQQTEQNVQSDWNQSDNLQDDYIKNKPTALSDFLNDLNFTNVGYVDSKIVQNIINGDITHSPSGDVIFDALSTKVNTTTLTSGRIPYTSSSNTLNDSSKLLWNNSNANLEINDTLPLLKIKENLNNTWFSIGVRGLGDGSMIIKNQNNKNLLTLINPNGSDEPQLAVGNTPTVPPESQLYIYGGENGANIDMRGKPSRDECNMDFEGNDWETDVPNSLGFSYFGSQYSLGGDVLGYPKNRLGHIRFGEADYAIITSKNQSSVVPIRFGINNVEISYISDKGWYYKSDFSGDNITNPRWIPDKEYIDNSIFNNIPLTGTLELQPVTGSIQFGDSIVLFNNNEAEDNISTIGFEDGTAALYCTNNTSSFSASLRVSPTEVNIDNTDPSSRGLKGGYDYTANITDLDYPQKKYVDNLAIKEGFVFIDKLENLPSPIGNTIILENNKTYFFTKSLDLQGNRLVCGENTVLLGGSSENATLYSTGLIGTPLITSNYSLPIRNLTITADIALNLNGDSINTALDWFGVNFKNCNTVGTIQNYTNHIWTDCAFLNSGGLTYNGTMGSIAINSSLFDTNTGQTAITIASTCTITRRFRIIYSAFIINAGQTGLNINSSAIIPTEGYILRVCNFSGGGTYTTGVTFNDNKSQFKENVGIPNSNEISQYFMNSNLTTTTISALNTPTKILGTTTSSSITQRYTNTNNRATYTGAITRVFEVKVTMSLTSGNNNQIGGYIAKNGVVLNESEIYVTTNGAGRSENIVLQTLVSLSTNDYIEVFIENNSSVTNILVTDLNVIIR